MTLDEIGLKHGTDKNSNTHGYLGVYERYFAPWRERSFTLMEIGVAEGRSLGMWLEYFTNATIVGIDVNPCDGVLCPGAKLFVGNQTDEAFMGRVLAQVGPPEIVIDDGGHKGHDVRTTFRYLFPRVLHGGFYAIEDTHCFYCDHYAEDSGAFQYFSGKAKDVDVAGRGMTGNVDAAINCHHSSEPLPEFSRELAAMHVHPSVWIFERR